jgi:Ca-activated chloride channel homolog
MFRVSSKFLVTTLGVFASLIVLSASGTPDLRSPAISGEQSPAPAGATITGTVFDASLVPVSGVTVTLERNGKAEATATSDAEGKFRFTRIAAGDYRVRAAKTGLPSFARDLRVAVGATTLNLPIVLANPLSAADMPPAGEARQNPVPTAMPTAPPPTAQTATAGGVTGGAGGGRGGSGRGYAGQAQSSVMMEQQYGRDYWPGYGRPSGETYARIDPNRFQLTRDQPLSTFGADVDTGSYTNIRRFLASGQLPPHDAVRIEELVNYFRFDYATPRDGRPIALTSEIGDCPWSPSHKLVLVGARARTSAVREIGGRNIVLLIDVSGSMAPQERLPLIRTALGLFVDTLRPDDTLSIVTYAGSSGVALFPTPARQRDVIQRTIASLSANGSTNGAQGLITAYRVATQAFIPGGVNRVILATDGDFNVGITTQRDLLQLIERERDSGVFLSVFGVGRDNLKDRTMEMLADHGNGHYAYLDSLQEARRVLIREADGTLETVAKDVKFQVEFNPAVVSAYKLLGYEKRELAAEDFNNDRKDAGDMGAGHTVTVLYEVIPVGADRDVVRSLDRPDVDPLKYQPQQPQQAPVQRPSPPAVTAHPDDWMTVKARFKRPDGDVSDLIPYVVRSGGTARYLPFASAVAEFGILLRDQPRNMERWDWLTRRVASLEVTPAQTADKEAFAELVAIASGLARLR